MRFQSITKVQISCLALAAVMASGCRIAYVPTGEGSGSESDDTNADSSSTGGESESTTSESGTDEST